MRGEVVENASESIRLFGLCEAMQWAHLPLAGGLYDQHPRLLEEWGQIFAAKAAKERKEQAKRNREHANVKNKGR